MSKIEQLREAVLMVYPEVYPGLHASVSEVWPDGVRTMFVKTVAATEDGNGAFGRWLDSLPTDVAWVFYMVVSKRAERALLHRGFTWSTFAGSDRCLSRRVLTPTA